MNILPNPSPLVPWPFWLLGLAPWSGSSLLPGLCWLMGSCSLYFEASPPLRNLDTAPGLAPKGPFGSPTWGSLVP
jgi:hypothetical protein